MIYDYSWPILLALTLGTFSGFFLALLVIFGAAAIHKEGGKISVVLVACVIAVFTAGAWFGWNGGARAQLAHCGSAHQ